MIIINWNKPIGHSLWEPRNKGTVIHMPTRIITCLQYFLCCCMWEALLSLVEQQRTGNTSRNGLWAQSCCRIREWDKARPRSRSPASSQGLNKDATIDHQSQTLLEAPVTKGLEKKKENWGHGSKSGKDTAQESRVRPSYAIHLNLIGSCWRPHFSDLYNGHSDASLSY